MKAIYTLKNIHDLLLEKYPNVEWNYEIYERATGKRRNAIIEDFSENMYDTLTLAFIHKNNEYSLDVAVSNFSFVVYEDEPNIMGSGSITRIKDVFTNDWTNLLLDEYEEKYAKILLRYSEKRKKQIKDNAEQKIANYAAEIKQKAYREASPYEDMSQKAKEILPITDIVNIEKEVNSIQKPYTAPPARAALPTSRGCFG